MSTRTFNVCSLCKTQWAKKPAKRSAVIKHILHIKNYLNDRVCAVCGDLKEATIETEVAS